MYSIEYPGEKRGYVLTLRKCKKIIKETARHILYLKNKKSYKYQVNSEVVTMCLIERNDDKEFFYGYYDKSPERNGYILFHVMDQDHVKIVVKALNNGEENVIGQSKAFNWQMGARALWLKDDIVSYNDFDGGKYVSKWYSLSKNKIVRTIPMPTMDVVEGKYILSPNFQKLQIIDPCYAYQNLTIPTDEQILDYNHDGIWVYDLEKDEKRLLLSISDILNCSKESVHNGGYHGLNHIMVSPDGDCFVFIHRCRSGCERYDRLMLYDFKNGGELSCLLDGKLQSHFCWIDNHTVFGYGERDNKVGFYKVDVNTKQSHLCEEVTKCHPRDGHPTVSGDWVVIDSYPDLSRMQSLIAYNHKTNEIVKIGEFFHDMKHAVYTRCDLHPRFNETGDKIYFDTLYSGKRELCSIKVKL